MRFSVKTLQRLSLFQPLFNFTAQKIVLIKDWRLGVLLRSLQVLVVLYVVYDLINKGAYLQSQVPVGTITSFENYGAKSHKAFFKEINKELPTEGHDYCFDQKAYNFTFRENSFTDFRCVYATPASLTSQGENEYFFATYFSLDKIFYTKPISTDNCPKPGDAKYNVPKGASLLASTADICVYEKTDHLFPINAEEAKMSFSHTYTTSDKHGSLPHTHVRSKRDEKGKTFKKDEIVDMSINDWLSIAGVDLDKTLDMQPYPVKPSAADKTYDALKGINGSGVEGFPMARLSGVELVITMQYYQPKLAPAEYRKNRKGSEVFCIIDVVPKFTWAAQGADVRYVIQGPEDPFFLYPNGTTEGDPGAPVSTEVNFQRTGIMFTFKTTGSVGTFSWRQLVTALITYSVMFSVAQTITTFIALYALGLSSQLYKEFILESVEWRKEYARYAAQALVAGYAFMQYDTDHSWVLSRGEIYKMLKKILQMPDEKIAALTDFLMRHGDEDLSDAVTHYTFDEENNPTSMYTTISIKEWLDIFTEDKVKLDSLVRLIDNEYKDPKQRELLVKLATNPSKTASGIREPLLSGAATENGEPSVTSHPVTAVESFNRK